MAHAEGAYVDKTQAVTQAAGHVPLLLLSDSLDLYDTISTAVLANRKLDLFVLSPLSPPGPATLSLLPAIFSSLCKCFSLWLNGSNVKSTIYSFLYSETSRFPYPADHFPSSLLTTFFSSIEKSVDLVASVVSTASIFDDEDFIIESLFELQSPIIKSSQTLDFVAQLDDAISDLNQKSESNTLEISESSVVDNVINWITFLKSLLVCCDAIHKGNFDDAITLSSACLESLSTLNSSQSQPEIDTSDAVSQYFSQTLHASNGIPASPIPLPTLSETLSQFTAIFTTINSISKISTMTPSQLLAFLAKPHHPFVTPTTQPKEFTVYERSILNNYIFKNTTNNDQMDLEAVYILSYPITKFARILLSEFYLPPYFKLTATDIEADLGIQELQNFTVKVNGLVKLYIDAMLRNQSRRRNALEIVVEQFEVVQAEVEKLDEVLQNRVFGNVKSVSKKGTGSSGGDEFSPYFLSSWVYSFKMRVMEQYLVLGFDLDLYQKWEFEMVLWYLEYLYDTHVQHITRLETSVIAYQYKQMTLDSKKKNKKKSKSVDPAATLKRPEFKLRDLLQVKFEYCRGLRLVFTGLSNVPGYATPTNSTDLYSSKLHYLNRFRLFARLASPLWIDYEEYLSRFIAPPVKMLETAKILVSNSKLKLEKIIKTEKSSTTISPSPDTLKTLESLLKNIIQNSLSIHLLVVKLKSSGEELTRSDIEGLKKFDKVGDYPMII
ncbi:hypothetical protein HK098_001746 [Nowakowskiella sp. JEL0407]|nr:hypothetical protein HK098_001746 [Nowakowskiella sp. JEL0407]